MPSHVPDATNRRAFFRQPMYRAIELRVQNIRAPIPATLVDLSEGGCRIAAHILLRALSQVQFMLSGVGDQPANLSGRVQKIQYSRDDRTFHYNVEFEDLSAGMRQQLLRFINNEQRGVIKLAREPIHARVAGGINHIRVTRERRGSSRVTVEVPFVGVVAGNHSHFEGTILDIGNGGVRMLCDRLLRQEWIVELRFTLPNDALRVLQQLRGGSARSDAPFQEMSISARALSGAVKHGTGYLHSLTFVKIATSANKELARFLHANHLLALRRERS